LFASLRCEKYWDQPDVIFSFRNLLQGKLAAVDAARPNFQRVTTAIYLSDPKFRGSLFTTVSVPGMKFDKWPVITMRLQFIIIAR